ncbi:MAG: adaptor protein MecA [Lachnospiraceae bacterium]|nr:adaptor protein MecA [Lachnospiraceae bacterium]
MRIEKINDNQIRCTLTKSDLEEHQVLLNELAFGTDHAKDLFRDMMAQASAEFGFEAEDIPLMIEAVPVSSEKLVLIITKMKSPDDLEDHFSKYMKPLDILNDMNDEDFEEAIDDDDIVSDKDSDSLKSDKDFSSPLSQLLHDVHKFATENIDDNKKGNGKKTAKQSLPETHRIYRFPSLAQVMDACSKIYPLYEGDNTLYKDSEENFYYLTMERGNHPQEDFKRIGNVLSEFALQIPYSYGACAYFDEHFMKIIEHDAVNTLASL